MSTERMLLTRRVAEHLGFELSTPQRQRLARAVDRLADGDVGALLGRALPGTAAFEELVESVLVSETYWFRDEAQLQAVVSLLAELPPSRRSVWSAGCATGQEPHSLAIMLHRAGVWPVQIVASDVSARAVRSAARGRYVLDRQRGLDAATAAAYGTVRDGVWSLRADLRSHITTVRHNILQDPPPVAQIVMCRNVLIYMTPQAVRLAIDRLRQGLARDGVLVVGHAETQLPGPGWRPDRQGGTFVFTAAEGPEAHTAAQTPEAHTAAQAPETHTAAARPEGGTAAEPRATAVDRPVPSTARHAPPPSDAIAVSELLHEGEAALDEGRHGEAITALRKARYLDPHDPVPAALLGIALARDGHLADARRAWTATRQLLARLPSYAVFAGGYPASAVQTLIDELEPSGPVGVTERATDA